jgi:hypothetical protein
VSLTGDAWFGGSVDVSTGGPFYTLGLPWGPGGKRLHVVRPSSATFAVLPLALFLREGADVFRIVNAGTANLTILGILGTPFATLTPGQVADLHLPVLTVEGLWQVYVRSGTATLGTGLADRKVVNLRLTTQTNLNLREYARSAGAFDDVPYAVTCTIAAGHVIGSTSVAIPAFDTGVWPAGTTIKLLLEAGARICGRGGAGGQGGLVPPSAFNGPGQAGGAAIQTWNNLVVVNRGFIQGGGGGGGGGTFVAVPGCGGGGGAGYLASEPGLGGFGLGGSGQLAAGNGQGGSIGLGGLGGVLAGHNSGGAGGGPGTAGSPGSSLGTAITAAQGGAAGAAIRYLSTVTVTKLVTGTINGAEVSF